jgi:succinate dehydrogenase/fumarate reductase flavoprotein subunit
MLTIKDIEEGDTIYFTKWEGFSSWPLDVFEIKIIKVRWKNIHDPDEHDMEEDHCRVDCEYFDPISGEKTVRDSFIYERSGKNMYKDKAEFQKVLGEYVQREEDSAQARLEKVRKLRQQYLT